MKNKFKNINRFLVDKGVAEFSEKINIRENILDVGAGSGQYRNFFKNKHYITIDMGLEQPDMKGINVIGDICLLPFKSSTLDNILCTEVLEHVWNTKIFFHELNRVLKNNGNLLLTVPLCFGEHMQPYDFYRYTRFSLNRLLESNGFEVIKIGPRGGYFTLIGYLISKIPDQILKAKNIPYLLRKLIKIVSRIIFTYIVTPIFLKLDYLDDKKYFTLGYICEAKKVLSLDAGANS